MTFAYSLDDYIDSVKEYMYKNNIVCPSVVAHSFGGRITIKSASQNANLYNKIVLTGCAGLKPKQSINKLLKKTYFNFLKRFYPKEKLTRLYSKDYLMLDDVMKQSFIKIVNEYLDLSIEKIQNQTLIIFGKNDRETPLYMARRLNKGIKNSKLTIYENAGHFCFLDCPNTFNLEVREFLLSK